MDYYDILLAEKLNGGGGGSAVLINKNISSNGTYNASTDNADGYKKVVVNVPNSYVAGDEGKVVSNGALVSQTSATYTSNNTYDTTLINSVTVDVSSSANFDTLIARSISGTLSTNASKIGAYALYNCSGLTSVSAPNCASVLTYAFNGCTGLTYLVLPSCNNMEANAIRACSNLVAYDYNGNRETASIGSNCFLDDTKLNMFVIRNTERIAQLGNTSAFNGTPFASGGTGGTLYVPNSLLSSYESASNWSTVLARTTNSIKSIESTHTDPDAPIDLTLYYADGTPIS